MSDALITVEGLRYSYRRASSGRPALDGISFTVRRGEIFGLLGPNGAGKTTVVKILTTILRPGSGRALVAGHDVVREPLAVRRSLVAVLQENAVETLLSVRDNLMLYGLLHGLARAQLEQRIRAVVDLLELGDYLRGRAQALSGGFKRRLQVAKALMVETPILFLDEATTGMDPLIKRRVIDALRHQAARGRTVVLTTQLLEEAEALCDHMVLMDAGRTLARGSLSELRALSRKMFRIHLSFAQPDAEASAALRAIAPRSLEERGGEIEMTVEGSEDEWIRHMARISERWPLSHFEIRGANLEQIFLELYGDPQAVPPQTSNDPLTRSPDGPITP
jgi:ABC-2 type transport system ATP-binding protein